MISWRSTVGDSSGCYGNILETALRLQGAKLVAHFVFHVADGLCHRAVRIDARQFMRRQLSFQVLPGHFGVHALMTAGRLKSSASPVHYGLFS